jgi:heme/copper-type cytochrome/quinol oxidase subunit 2
MHVVVLSMWTLAAVGTLVAMFFCVSHYRRTTDCATHFHRSALVEMVWTAVPCVILIAGAIPAARLIWSNAGLSSPMARAPARYLPLAHDTHVAYPCPVKCPAERVRPGTDFGYPYH